MLWPYVVDSYNTVAGTDELRACVCEYTKKLTKYVFKDLIQIG